MVEKVTFESLKTGDCFKLRKNSRVIYQKDYGFGYQVIKGSRAGHYGGYEDSKKVIPIKVKIVEVK